MGQEEDLGPSSPVSGAISLNDLQSGTPVSLPENLTRAEWKTLAIVARGLLELASVHLGESRPGGCLICHNVTTDEQLTVGELIKDFLLAKAKSGRSDRYLRALRVSLRSFANGRFHLPIGNVTVSDLEAWLEAGGWAARTQRGYLTDVHTLFSFAVRRGLLERNPAAAVEPPVFQEPPPSIHSPDQVKTVLDFARGYELNICRALAVRYFAGLRSSEADRLNEREIGAKYIEVTAAKSKTRRRRLVAVQPNLRAWLELGGKLPLHDANTTWRDFRQKLKQVHGMDWPHNVTRHSFISYHVAKWGNAGKTALEAGHGEAMLFAHYRELVTPEAAERFWELKPA